jgi:hypothetical protein
MRVFAAGSENNRMRIEVRWRSGKRSVIKGVRANREYEIDETQANTRWEEPQRWPKPKFEDVSGLLKHVHEDAFDDFTPQAMLLRKLSQWDSELDWSGCGWDEREDLP